MPRTMVNFNEKSSKITVFLDDFSPKLTKVRPKSVSWRSNQEWPSICADTVYLVCSLDHSLVVCRNPDAHICSVSTVQKIVKLTVLKLRGS